MNIKIKAGLTVLAFFGCMIVTAWGIISIPKEWIETIFKVAIVIAALAFSYKVAYDYYVADQELKRLAEQDKRKIEEGNSRIK